MFGGRGRLRSAVVGVLAAGAGLGATTALASAPTTTPHVVVQAYAIPASDYTSPVSSYLEPIATDPDGTGEFVIVNDTGAHTSRMFKEPLSGGTPSLVESLGEPAYTVSFAALVADKGYDWGLSEDALYGGIGPTGGGTINAGYAEPTAVRDLTVGSDGDLYWTDNAGLINQDIVVAASLGALNPGTQYSAPSGVQPDAIAVAGGTLWFTSDSAQLYSLNPTGPGTIAGPFSAAVSQFAHTLAADASGNLWAVGGGLRADGGDEILEIDPANGTTLHTDTSGLPNDPGITAMTVGPDGNIWFTESRAQAIGELDVSTGQITNRQLPGGYQLPAAGSDVIAAGPAGSGEVFFGVESAGASSGTTSRPGIGVVTGIGGTTTTGTVSVSGTASVSSKGVASVSMSCHGAAGAVCAGTVTLSHAVTVKGTGGKRTKVVTTSLGSAKYRVTAGQSAKLAVKLDTAAVKLLAAAAKHRLTVTATVKPASGAASTHTLTLVGAATKGHA